MAGPGKSGPPKKGREQVEFALLKADVVRMRRADMSHAEIARRTGLSRPTVTQMLPRIFREMLQEAGVEELRMIQFRRCEVSIESLWDRIIDPEPGDHNGHRKDIDTLLRILKREADLM